jgi:hypothetical protein
VRLRAIRVVLVLALTLASAPLWAHGLNGRMALGDLGDPPRPSADPVAAPARMPGSAPRASLAPAPRRFPRGGTRAAEATGVLIVAAGLAGFARAGGRDRRMTAATATAALVLGFVIETTPHLVHHSLDPDTGAGCQVLQTAERSLAALGTPDVVPVETQSRLVETPATETAPARPTPAARGRAPPA